MKTFDTSLVVLETTSLTIGLQALEAMVSAGEMRIIEASPIGEARFLVLASGKNDVLESGLEEVYAQLDPEIAIVDREHLEKFDPRLLEAAFSLSQQRLEQSLVVVETETVSGLFAVAQALVAHQPVKPIEIKIRRSVGGAHAYFTGTANACALAAEEARARLKKAFRKGRVEWFEKPSPALKSLFDFV